MQYKNTINTFILRQKQSEEAYGISISGGVTVIILSLAFKSCSSSMVHEQLCIEGLFRENDNKQVIWGRHFETATMTTGREHDKFLHTRVGWEESQSNQIDFH